MLSSSNLGQRYATNDHHPKYVPSSSLSNDLEDEDNKILHAVTRSQRNWNENTNLNDVTPTPTTIVKHAPPIVNYHDPDNDPSLLSKKDPNISSLT